jgi:hypothetical protein
VKVELRMSQAFPIVEVVKESGETVRMACVLSVLVSGHDLVALVPEDQANNFVHGAVPVPPFDGYEVVAGRYVDISNESLRGKLKARVESKMKALARLALEKMSKR